MNSKVENVRYSLLMCCVIMMQCVGMAYATYFLLSVGATDRIIGVIVAISCIIATIAGPVIGRLVDKSVRIGSRGLMMILSSMIMVLAAVLSVCPVVAVKILCHGVLLCMSSLIIPTANTFNFCYERSNVKVDYGFARGFGSLGYSAISFALGYLTMRLGPKVIPVAFLLLGGMIFALTATMGQFAPKTAVENDSGRNGFNILKYPLFLAVLIGMSFSMIFHNMFMTYLIRIIENIGGDSHNLGIAIGVASTTEIPLLFLFTQVRKRLSTRNMLLISSLAFTLKAVCMIFIPSVSFIYLIQLTHFLAYGMYVGARVYFSSEVLDEAHESTGQALVTSTETIGTVAGSVLGGMLITNGNVMTLLHAGAIIASVGAIIMITSSLVFGKKRNK